MFHWVLCASNILTLLDSSRYTSSSVLKQLPFADEWNHLQETEPSITNRTPSQHRTFFSVGATVESFPWAGKPDCFNVCYAYVHRKFWHYNNIYIILCIMHPQEILALFLSLSFMPSRDFLGAVPSCIMHVFTGDPGFVSLCITNPQEMFYCISYVYPQEILALFECVSCMLGKHFTD